MKRFVVLILLAISGLAQAQREKADTYINAYKEIAIAEMQRTGVPASITLAQGILESQYGESDLAKTSNNHFGIKCKPEWTGARTYHDDDEKKECFRVYPSVEESYKDHSNFLRTRDHYAFLFKLDPTDDSGWAYGLKKAGYATEKDYPQRLLQIINNYQLQQYSRIALERNDTTATTSTPTSTTIKNTRKLRVINQTNTDALAEPGSKPDVLVVNNTLAATEPEEEKKEAAENDAPKKVTPIVEESKKTSPYPEGVFNINHTRVIYVNAGTSLLSIAEKFGISLSKLFEFNELPETDILDKDQLIFLEKKLKKGATDFHLVTSSETITEISQKEGVRRDSLLEYNNLKKDSVLNAGDKIYLRTSPATTNIKTVKAPK